MPPAIPAASPAGSWPGGAVAVVHAIDGALIAIDRSGGTIALATGDAVAPGDVLITRAGGYALIDLSGGASLAMSGEARAEIRGADGDGNHVVAHAGAFAVTAGGNAAGEASAVRVETGAAILAVEGGTLGFRYSLEAGLSGAFSPGAGEAPVLVVNDSGTYVVDGANPFAVAQWSEPPELLSTEAAAGGPEWLPPDLPDAADAPPPAEPASATSGGDGASPGAEADGGLAFATGAGPAADGDPTFVFASPSSSSSTHGLSDLAPAAAPLPAFAPEPALAAPPPRAAPPAPGHDVDALFLWQPPAGAQLPPPPSAPPAPNLRGWEPTGHTWDISGCAWVSGGDREGPIFPDLPMVPISPTEGRSMAALKPREAHRAELESFLGLQHDELNGLVDGVVAYDGSALRTSITLKAGQALAFDVLFDAVESLPSNDYAAFTVAHGGVGEGFVLSSVAATGSFGTSPWQTIRYTAGASGTFTIGFVVVNDEMPMGLSRLYVDAMRSAVQRADLHVIADKTDGFGGHFELLAPKPDEHPGESRLISGFDSNIDPAALIGRVAVEAHFAEPDGCRSAYTPTEGASMAVLYAKGGMRASLESFLGLEKAPDAPTALPIDADGSMPNYGAATKLTVAVAAGDRISFDWMFDAGDRLPDNDFAVFTVSGDGGSQVFKLADVRATGEVGASGWRTSVYTASGDEQLTIGFAVVNDRISGLYDDPENSRLLVDNVWLNRDFADGYQLATSPIRGSWPRCRWRERR